MDQTKTTNDKHHVLSLGLGLLATHDDIMDLQESLYSSRCRTISLDCT